MDHMSNRDYIRKLVLKIQPIFELHVKPSNVLTVFHKYDSGVLTQRDIEHVRSCSQLHGDIEGAIVLLDRLKIYYNWYNCLLSVLRDDGVKLRHAADAIQREKERIDAEFNGVIEFLPKEESTKQQVQVHTGNQRNLVPSSIDSRHTLTPLNMSLITMSLQEDSPAAVTATMPAETNYIEAVDVDYPLAGACQNESPSPGNVVEDQRRPKIISEIPERNFEPDEVNVLSSLQGWHADIEDRMVLELLKPLRGEPGCYILWYWSNKKRPAICVTHENEVKTLLIHKRPDPADAKKVAYYFINKDERRSSLKEIVHHHLQNGVYDLSRRPQKVKITFIRPI